jgi:hypothetical protein
MRSGAKLIFRAEWRIGFALADIISAVGLSRTWRDVRFRAAVEATIRYAPVSSGTVPAAVLGNSDGLSIAPHLSKRSVCEGSQAINRIAQRGPCARTVFAHTSCSVDVSRLFDA